MEERQGHNANGTAAPSTLSSRSASGSLSNPGSTPLLHSNGTLPQQLSSQYSPPPLSASLLQGSFGYTSSPDLSVPASLLPHYAPPDINTYMQHENNSSLLAAVTHSFTKFDSEIFGLSYGDSSDGGGDMGLDGSSSSSLGVQLDYAPTSNNNNLFSIDPIVFTTTTTTQGSHLHPTTEYHSNPNSGSHSPFHRLSAEYTNPPVTTGHGWYQ